MKFMPMAVLFMLVLSVHAVQAQTTVKYVHTDALGSVVALTNGSGAVLEGRREYEPYGYQTTPAIQDGPGYTGHVQDAATGLTYMQQRYYDPQLGVFLSVDPVTAFDLPVVAFNRYRYAANNPYRFVDPDGRLVRLMDDRPQEGRDPIGDMMCQRVCLGQGGSPRTNGGEPSRKFTKANAQARYDAANFAVKSVQGKVGEIRHETEDSAAQTFEHVFQPISNRFGVEIDAGIDGSRLGGGFYLFGIQVGHQFRSDGIGYSVLGGLGRDVSTIHSHPIVIPGAPGYTPFGTNDLNWLGSTTAPMHYVSDSTGLYRYNGVGVPASRILRLDD